MTGVLSDGLFIMAIEVISPPDIKVNYSGINESINNKKSPHCILAIKRE